MANNRNKGPMWRPYGNALVENPDGVSRTFGDCESGESYNTLRNSRSASGGPAGYGYGPFSGGDAGGSYGAFPDYNPYGPGVVFDGPVSTSGVTSVPQKPFRIR